MKLRINKRKNIVRVNRRKLGRSIEERDNKIETREEFKHWEIDTVEGLKDKKDNVLLALIEKNTKFNSQKDRS